MGMDFRWHEMALVLTLQKPPVSVRADIFQLDPITP